MIENNDNLFLYFKLGGSKYAVNVKHVVEIMKLPLLDYPQKLANNVIGLLNYNNFTINVLDLRFYLNISITPYSVSNQLLIVKTDETIFGLLIDKVEDIVSLSRDKMEYLNAVDSQRIIDVIFKDEKETISVVDLNALENVIKIGVTSSNIDVPSLFPHDDDSQYEFLQRNQILQEKSSMNLITNAFSQNKFISFSLNQGIYCIDIENVGEFLKNLSITKIPCNADYVEGVVVLKGDFVTVINTKKFLGLTDDFIFMKQSDITKPGSKNNVIIVQVADYKVGFLVDEIFDIINIPEELIKTNSQNREKYILSELVMDEKFYTILNIKNILADEKFFIEE